ncbi:hypothetical protein TNCV_738611 [Trichonephila clavipes]|nr:hypothetical protein TNCV_738611 [Trichonephila clavipes]
MPINLGFLIAHEKNLQKFWLRIGSRKQRANCVAYLPLDCESRAKPLHRNNAIRLKRCHMEAYVAVVPFQQQRVCEIQLLRWFLNCIVSAFGTALVSQQLCELPHAPPVQVFAVRLVETFR